MSARNVVFVLFAVVTTAMTGSPSSHRASPAVIPFRVFTHTSLNLTDVAWTGNKFLYVDNTTNKVSSSPANGQGLVPFARMPRQVEETRCEASPGSHGFAAGDIFCHSPDNKIYRISADGKSVTVFATLPHVSRSDGALIFDTVGRFGYRLLAASGRSGNPAPRGGVLFAISPSGAVRRIGAYNNAGGADEIAVAPSHFGDFGGEVLCAVDAGHSGSIVAMDPAGHARTVATLPDGPNPIGVIAPGLEPHAGSAAPGLYITDTYSHDVFFAPTSAFRSYAGDVVVATELRAQLWLIRPRGQGVTTTLLPTTLPKKDYTSKGYNVEGGVYLAH